MNDWGQTLSEGLNSLGLSLDDRAQQALLLHMSLLQKWNQTYNLTARSSPHDMLTHHVLDCLAILPALLRHSGQGQALRVLDVGSGAGLPGVVLAVCRPEWEVTCLDAVAKKTAFVQQVAGALGLSNLRARHGRVEALTETWPLVVSRAYASLRDFSHDSEAALAPAGTWLAMKGKRPDAEIAALPTTVQVFHVEQVQVPGLDAERCLVWMRRPQGKLGSDPN